MLIELKNYLAKAKTASLQDLSQRFNSEAQLIRQMISLLLNKGLVRKVIQAPACGKTCGGCDRFASEIYEWIRVEPLSK